MEEAIHQIFHHIILDLNQIEILYPLTNQVGQLGWLLGMGAIFPPWYPLKPKPLELVGPIRPHMQKQLPFPTYVKDTNHDVLCVQKTN